MTHRPEAPATVETQVPVAVLWEGVLLAPVVGILDSYRAQQLMDAVLEGAVAHRSRVVVIDVLGVEAMDTAVANHLIQITQAIRLLGARCIVSGISPTVAQTIVHLGIDLAGVHTTSTLARAVATAFEWIGARVVIDDAAAA